MLRKSSFLLTLAFILGILFPLNINAQLPGDSSNPSDKLEIHGDFDAQLPSGSSNSSGKLTVHEIVTGIILIVTGIIFCFFGKRVYRLTLFLIGFYIGVIVAWIALSNGEPKGGFGGSASLTIILLVSLAVGFVVGLLFMCFSTIAIWLLGALTGCIFALWILSWASGGVIHSKAGRIIFILVLALIGLLLAIFFKNILIILGTAFIGAYAIILGIDMFARTGFAQSVSQFMDGNHDVSYVTDAKVYIMLAALFVLFIIGSLVQHKYYKDHHFGPKEVSGKRRRFWA